MYGSAYSSSTVVYIHLTPATTSNLINGSKPRLLRVLEEQSNTSYIPGICISDPSSIPPPPFPRYNVFRFQCFCGSSSDVVGDVGFATCDMACAGNADEICGGWNVMSVYRYDYTTPTPTVPPTPAPLVITPTAYDYIGCAFDSNGHRVLSGESTKGDPEMTTEVRVLY